MLCSQLAQRGCLLPLSLPGGPDTMMSCIVMTRPVVQISEAAHKTRARLTKTDGRLRIMQIDVHTYTIRVKFNLLQKLHVCGPKLTTDSQQLTLYSLWRILELGIDIKYRVSAASAQTLALCSKIVLETNNTVKQTRFLNPNQFFHTTEVTLFLCNLQRVASVMENEIHKRFLPSCLLQKTQRGCEKDRLKTHASETL